MDKFEWGVVSVGLISFFSKFIKGMPQAVAWSGLIAAVIAYLLVQSPQEMRPSNISITFLVVAALCAGAAIHFWRPASPGPKPEAFAPALQPVPPNPLPTTPAPAHGTTGQREFVDLNFEALAARTKGLNGIEAGRVYDYYIGKWIRVSGKIDEIIPAGTSGPIVVRLQSPTANAGNAYMTFDRTKWAGRLGAMSKGEPLMASCRIEHVQISGMTLTECEVNDSALMQAPPSPPPPTARLMEEMPTKDLSDGTFLRQFKIRLDTKFPPNALIVLVWKEDAMPPRTGPPGPGPSYPISLMPNFSGASLSNTGEFKEFYFASVQTPRAGEYIASIWVKSLTGTPRIELAIE